MNLGQLLHGKRRVDAPGAIGRARAYEALATVAFAGRRRSTYARVVALAGVTPGDRVLDVGCGTGFLTALAAEAARPGGCAVGVDVSEQMVEQARRLREVAGCTFRVGRAEALDVADASFDVVVSSLAVHHIPEDLRAPAFAEVFRVLTPGGRVLIADFPPPRGHLARHLVGAVAGSAMRDNPVERIAPLLTDVGFAVDAVERVGALLHCVRAVKPGGDA
ncbi:class I SAM-dependent methyltransferase [Actinosynnema sp. CS-041913]|uniref:class I SAM-dependent methyltransferase n=1 Tax=Actinosynnema sp. CS-041913 TaxID=3239917 RepID=UPI003D8C058E